MKLHARLILSLAICVAIIIIIGQILMYFKFHFLLKDFTGTQNNRLAETYEQSARNICISITRSVSGSLERGEMKKFCKIIRAQHDIKGLIEFSLFDQHGVVSHSSIDSSIGKKIPSHVFSEIQETKNEVFTWENDAIEIYQPRIIDSNCIRCHINWKLNEIGGIEYFSFSTESMTQSELESKSMIRQMKTSFLSYTLFIVLLIISIIMIAYNYMLQKVLSKPLKRFTIYLKQIASGDLSKKIPVKSHVEIGEMEKALNQMVNDFHKIIHMIKSGISNLSTPSDQMVNIFEQLTNLSNNLIKQIKAVTNTSSQMNESITTISDSSQNISQSFMSISNNSQELSKNVNVIAITTEKMQLSMRTIENISKEGKIIVSEAMTLAEKSSNIIVSLNKSAQDISNVTAIIRKIAYKTNILALNASIEAAAAGEAGKGFEVVANDIQLFADQSRKASENINNKIKKVQADTKHAVVSMDAVFNAMQRINESMKKIFVSIEKQSHASSEIVENVFESDQRAKEIAESMKHLVSFSESITLNVKDASSGINELAHSIEDLHDTSENAHSMITTIKKATSDLDLLTGELKKQVISFKT